VFPFRDIVADADDANDVPLAIAVRSLRRQINAGRATGG
jgi:hypothetical protein